MSDVSFIETDYISRKKLAKLLGEKLRGKPYNERTLIQWERRKYGPPAQRVGDTCVYSVAGVKEWLAKGATA